MLAHVLRVGVMAVGLRCFEFGSMVAVVVMVMILAGVFCSKRWGYKNREHQCCRK